jgi:LemA protein
MTALIIAAAAVVVVLAVVVLSYNRFVRQRQFIDNAWANVETELRRRYDLIPNLVETVKGYATHERTTLEQVTLARQRAVANHGSPVEQAGEENVLVGALGSLLAVAEAYPALEADAHFLDLQRQLTATEDRIQAARRFYNNNVRDYNERVQTVPSLLVAKAFGFGRREYFEIDRAVGDAGAPPVGFGGEPTVGDGSS